MLHQAPAHVQSGVLGPVSSWPSEARAEHSVMGGTQQVGHGSGSDGSREEGSIHVAKSGGAAHHPDHAQRQQQLLQHQQQYQYHQQQQYSQQDREQRTQYRLNTPQSDSASPAGSPTQPPKVEPSPTPPLTTKQKDRVTSQGVTEVTNHKQTDTVKVSQKEGNEREESGSANSGDSAGGELANQGREKDSKLTNGDGHLSKEERRQKLLEMVQREPDKHLHPHHRHQRPKPTTFKTGKKQVLSSVCVINAGLKVSMSRHN